MSKLSQLTDLAMPRPLAGAAAFMHHQDDSHPTGTGDATGHAPPLEAHPHRIEHPTLARLEQLAREELAALAPVLPQQQGDLLDICLDWDLARSGD